MSKGEHVDLYTAMLLEVAFWQCQVEQFPAVSRRLISDMNIELPRPPKKLIGRFGRFGLANQGPFNSLVTACT
jgi:hypothetical protein